MSKLEPAHFLVVEGRSLHVEEFWDLPVPSKAHAPRDVAGAVQGALKSAVRHELKDNKRAGLLYSGGVASCALLSAAPATVGIPITVDTDLDPSELVRSDAAAARLGRLRELEPVTRPMSSLVDELRGISGEPIADPSALTQLAMCKAAARAHGRRPHRTWRGGVLGAVTRDIGRSASKRSCAHGSPVRWHRLAGSSRERSAIP